MAESGKIERKYMAHFINATPNESAATYVRLGKDLEEFTIEMNPTVETKTNILGESSTNVSAYAPQASVSPYYAEAGTDLFDWLQACIDGRLALDNLKTQMLDVHLWDETSTTGSYKAFKEDVIIEITSYDGDVNGYQIPFTVHYVGNRTEGVFKASDKSFT